MWCGCTGRVRLGWWLWRGESERGAGSVRGGDGPSGSGKSTLLHCLAGLDSPTSGSVLIAGQDLAGMNDKQLTRVRRDRLGFVFQAFNLLPP